MIAFSTFFISVRILPRDAVYVVVVCVRVSLAGIV